MTGITRAEVAHLAHLARLDLTEDELDHYAAQLDVILQSVARVSEVATDDIPATSHPIPCSATTSRGPASTAPRSSPQPPPMRTTASASRGS